MKKKKVEEKKDETTKNILAVSLIIAAFVFFIVLSYEQTKAHDYCEAYNAQAELTNIALDGLTHYTGKQYPIQHQIDCPKSMSWRQNEV